MTARLGNVLYWLGTIIAVLAIGGAVVWNGWTFYEVRYGDSRIFATELAGLEPWERVQLWDRVVEARKSGYTDAEIADSLSKKENFDVKGARDSGYSDVEIIDELTGAEFRRKIAANEERQEIALFVGVVLVLGGIVAFGIGWAARYILRGSVK